MMGANKSQSPGGPPAMPGGSPDFSGKMSDRGDTGQNANPMKISKMNLRLGASGPCMKPMLTRGKNTIPPPITRESRMRLA